MVLVLVLQVLQRIARFPQDLVLPHLQLGAEILALPLVHERLSVGRPITVQAVEGLLGQRMAVFLGHALLLFFLPQHPTATPCTATPSPRAAGLYRQPKAPTTAKSFIGASWKMRSETDP